MYDAVMLNSGGMDSFLLGRYLAHTYPECRIGHVFVDVGQRYAYKELQAARYVADISGATLEHMQGAKIAAFEHPSGIIPFRNAEMLLCAAQHSNDIYYGVIADEVNSDKSPGFASAMTDVLDISHRKQYWTDGRTFTIHTPLRPYSKTELLRQYLHQGHNLGEILRTVSCYASTHDHCGKCSSCFKRWVALENNGVGLSQLTGHARFAVYPWLQHTPGEWKEKMFNYSMRRAKETRAALRAVGYL